MTKTKSEPQEDPADAQPPKHPYPQGGGESEETKTLLRDKPHDYIERTKPETLLQDVEGSRGQLTRDNVNPNIPSAPRSPSVDAVIASPNEPPGETKEERGLERENALPGFDPRNPNAPERGEKTGPNSAEPDAQEVSPLPPGGQVASINEPPGSDVLALRFSVSSISPTEGEAGGEDVPLTVNGAGFEDGAQVVVNNAALPTTFVSDTQLTTTLTAAEAAGVAQVTVAQTGFICEPAQTFTWNDPPVEGRRGKRRRED